MKCVPHSIVRVAFCSSQLLFPHIVGPEKYCAAEGPPRAWCAAHLVARDGAGAGAPPATPAGSDMDLAPARRDRGRRARAPRGGQREEAMREIEDLSGCVYSRGIAFIT